ncbi:rhodanese-like domain-containing protein [Actinomycetospora soli]|uniref:rhodanese-like domain-containing protein n=1 Tax=Actinomycetospora soli TaxID=2893887 RepID=UPI001E50D2F6|nr:rhodanese-like domain-containing protein [Actinomycetospora soli]MCD2191139.1 rhodanese-like domain-containing protein [Actinomycetospora soli]
MTVPEITVDDVAATQETDATILIDVRDPEEYAAGHIPGARLVPLPQLADHLPELRDARELQVVCQSGNRSARAVEYLTEHGVPAVSVVGGTKAWIDAGHPVRTT